MDIKVGQTYDYFDDGKIRESRRHKVFITDVIPFSEIDDVTLYEWRSGVVGVVGYEQLFANFTDYFVKGVEEVDNTELIFVRTIDGGWFSFNNYRWDGRLDIDGSLLESLNKEYEK